MTCEVYGLGYYTGPIILETEETAGDRISVTVDDTEITVHGRELIKAIENCMNN